MSRHEKQTQLASLRGAIAETGKRIDYYKRNALARQIRLMQLRGIDLVMDVGANTGQYGRRLRKAGYHGEIVSFEPLDAAFASLQRTAKRDKNWRAARLALGAHERDATLCVSGDSRASSLKQMLDLHTSIAPYFSTVSHERVQIKTLDSVWEEHIPSGKTVYLKIDAQGAEKDIIDGAMRSMERIEMVQIEISIRPLYEESLLLPDALTLMDDLGFRLVSIEYGFCHPDTGQMLQVDGVFARS
jgi:FkbM family methyltransferase